MRAATSRVLRVAAFALASVALAGPAAAQTIGAAGWPVERPPRPLPAHSIEFPPYELKTLPNGLQLLLIPWHEQPSVSMRLIIKAGAAQDPAEKPGIASMVAALLDQGTATKTSEGIANIVESSGGVLGVGAGNELSFVNAGVVKDKFDVLMALMSELVQQPAFDEGELTRLRQQALSAMQVSYQSPDFVAGVAFDRLIYGFHPYGRPPGGTLESLPRITRADLQAYHRTWFAPNNAILAIVGDLSAAEMLAGAEKAFGSWAKREVPAQTQADPPPPTRRVVVIDKPGAVQTEIRAGQITLPRTSPDWLDLELLIRVLGGEGANRLFNELRGERGLTYGANAELETFKYAGGFVASTATRTEATAEALRLLVDEVWRLQRENVSPGELRGVRDYFIGSFPLTVETPSAIALQVLNQMFYGLDVKDLDRLRDRVDAVTVQDLQTVARKWLKPDRLSIVLVGDASKFMSQLAAMGFDAIERIPIDELDLSSPTLRRGGRADTPAAVPAATTPAAIETVKKVADAKGGLAVLRAVKSVDVSANVTITGEGDPVKFTTRNLIAYPGRFRVEANTPSGRIVQVFNAGRAWIETPAGVIDADAASQADYAASAARDLIPLLVAAADGRVPVAELPDESIDGAPVHALKFGVNAGGPLIMLVDARTYDVRELRYPTEESPDAPQAVERFGDYRAVDGVRVAFHATVAREGVTIDRVLSGVAFNTPLADALFIKVP
jgi:zinc protease